MFHGLPIEFTFEDTHIHGVFHEIRSKEAENVFHTRNKVKLEKESVKRG